MSDVVTIRKVEADDVVALLFLSKKTFFDAFYCLNNPGDMALYAARYFTVAQMQAEWSNPQSDFYFADLGNEVVGYMKINYGQAQTDLQDSTSLEVERIYVSDHHQGKQIGKELLNFAMQTATNKRLKYVWLGVWEQNRRAIRFYQNHGFKSFGQHNFMLGNDLQVDVLMKLVL